MIILFDGAMGTMLYDKNLMGECNELLNITNPCDITNIHKSYALAGADYVKCNTFGASPLKLSKSCNEDKAYEINAAAYQLAKQSKTKVAGNIGSSGELYFPLGIMSTQDIYNSYLVQAEALKECDCILIETMSSLVEANLALMAVRYFKKEMPVIVSFTYTNGYTMMGCTPELVAKAFNNTDIFAIGTNCSGGPVELVDVVLQYRKFSNKPISAMPNAGLPILDGDITKYPFTPEDYCLAMKDIVNAGANIIGGCCGTTPEHINLLKEYKSYKSPIPIVDDTIYIATEREVSSIENAVNCSTSEDDILAIEDQGNVARIDVSSINNLEEYMDSINMLSAKPKCFIATKDQEQLLRILYHGITDIIVK